MSDKINLTRLRADIEADEGYGDSWHLSPACALALIDTAEAAIAFDRSAWTHTDPPLKRRLRESLAHFTTEGSS